MWPWRLKEGHGERRGQRQREKGRKEIKGGEWEKRKEARFEDAVYL